MESNGKARRESKSSQSFTVVLTFELWGYFTFSENQIKKYFVNIYSQSTACLYIFLTLSFTKQKFSL